METQSSAFESTSIILSYVRVTEAQLPLVVCFCVCLCGRVRVCVLVCRCQTNRYIQKARQPVQWCSVKLYNLNMPYSPSHQMGIKTNGSQGVDIMSIMQCRDIAHSHTASVPSVPQTRALKMSAESQHNMHVYGCAQSVFSDQQEL